MTQKNTAGPFVRLLIAFLAVAVWIIAIVVIANLAGLFGVNAVIVLAAITGAVAHAKGYPGAHWVLWGTLFPVIALFVIAFKKSAQSGDSG